MSTPQTAAVRYALLGPGTFSEEAAAFFFAGDQAEPVRYRHIADVFQAVVSGEVEYAVIPIENTIEGSVSLHMDWLVHEVDVPMQAEWVYPIRMNLLGMPDAPFGEIRKVVSHSVAYAQCRAFLRGQLPQAQFESVSTTAEGARLVAEKGDPSMAAIGMLSAAEMYGLTVLARDVQDHDNNYTRFVLIGQRPYTSARNPGPVKTTVLVTLPEDYPGALHQLLSAFAWRRINLSKLESRPTKKKLGNYYFYIDIEASIENVLLANTFAEIEALGCQVRVMGSYPTYGYEVADGQC